MTLRDLFAGIGLVGAFFLTLAASGFLLIILDFLGVPERTGLIPSIGDPRALVVSSLGLLVIGLTPLTLRLLVQDATRPRQ